MSFLDELFAFVGFDDGDRVRLRALHPLLAPAFEAMTKQFYDAVFASPAAAVLASPEQVDRLRASMIDWMSSGLLGPHDDQFYRKRSRIGRRHVEVGLPSQYMFTAMTVLRLAYVERVSALYPADEAFAVLRSVHKLLDCELAMMVQHYELDTEDKLVARERQAHDERIAAMRTMTAGLAHEIRNPLNAAKLQLELLERRLQRAAVDAPLVEPALLARSEIERLSKLVDEFLVFARPTPLQLDDRDVVAIVRQAIDAAAGPRKTRVEIDADPPAVIAAVDAGKLRQVVHNLVQNACEAAGPGGRVRIAVRGDDTRCVIRVADDGPGIPDHVRPRIYEPFFSTKDGTGLGMSIVHSLVALHGGTIDVATGPTGTVFEVALPRRH